MGDRTFAILDRGGSPEFRNGYLWVRVAPFLESCPEAIHIRACGLNREEQGGNGTTRRRYVVVLIEEVEPQPCSVCGESGEVK